MKTPSLFVLSVLHTVASITAVSVTHGSVKSYDPAELLSKIFNPSTTLESRQQGYGLIKFEDQTDPGPVPDNDDPGQYGLIDPGQRPLRYEDDYEQNYNSDIENQQSVGTIKFQELDNVSSNNGGVSFQDDNRVQDHENKKKRKRRRRRKPKNGVLPYPVAGAVAGLPLGRPGADQRPGFQGHFQAGYGHNSNENSGYPIHPIRSPRRRPKPSLATEALASITGALTSIARYDDSQCVPRLLCEAAGGGALSGSAVLQSIAGIQPLLTLLSVYNGISTSPLFVFGRAVFLGMTSKGNTGTCRYAYPQCPTDPEQLIYYLNNHNGGFFRFFNAPQLPDQNIEQFYNQLGNQGFGNYQTQQNAVNQNYGYPNDPNTTENYGLYQNNQLYQQPNVGLSDSQYYGQNYGSQRPYERPSLYNSHNSSPYYANDYNYGSGNQIRFKDDNARIEKRIQNQPAQNLAEGGFVDDVVSNKWQFPNDLSSDVQKIYYNIRDSRTVKFPEEGQSYNEQKDSIRKGKQVYFPNNENNQNYYNNRQQAFTNNRYQTTTYSYTNDQNHQYYNTKRPNTYTNNNNYKPLIKYNNYDNIPNSNNNNNQNYQTQQNYYNKKQNIYNNNHKYQSPTTYNNEEYVFDHKHNFYVKKENNYYNNAYSTNNFKRIEDDAGVNTVYVVRGNGDPNKPEIVKLRPGQSVY